MSYTRSQFISRINAAIQGRIGILVDKNETANEAIREVISQVDLRTMKRQSTLAPMLFNGIYDYAAPSDLKRNKITDIPPQVKREDGDWYLTTPEEFDRFKNFRKGMLALDDYNGTRTLKIASRLQDFTEVVSELDSLTSGGGVWTTVGDLMSLAVDTDDFIKGGGSLTGNIGSGGTTTAGIQNTALNSFDATDYFGGDGAMFVWVKINSVTNLTNYILKIGSSISNYYSKTVTARADGTAFVAGWNLLRFDISSYSTTGSPDKTKITFISVYMTKTAGKISETAYKFDWLCLKKGMIYNIRYYTKYGWQNSSGAYIENSSSDSDVLIADTDEYNLFIHQGKIIAFKELKEYDIVTLLEKEWEIKKKAYEMDQPSESKIMTTEYYSYTETLGHNYGNNDTDNSIYP